MKKVILTSFVLVSVIALVIFNNTTLKYGDEESKLILEKYFELLNSNTELTKLSTPSQQNTNTIWGFDRVKSIELLELEKVDDKIVDEFIIPDMTQLQEYEDVDVYRTSYDIKYEDIEDRALGHIDGIVEDYYYYLVKQEGIWYIEDYGYGVREEVRNSKVSEDTFKDAESKLVLEKHFELLNSKDGLKKIFTLEMQNRKEIFNIHPIQSIDLLEIEKINDKMVDKEVIPNNTNLQGYEDVKVYKVSYDIKYEEIDDRDSEYVDGIVDEYYYLVKENDKWYIYDFSKELL